MVETEFNYFYEALVNFYINAQKNKTEIKKMEKNIIERIEEEVKDGKVGFVGELDLMLSID